MTGRLAYEQDINDTTLGYVSYTRGFKPGGSNLTFGRESVVSPVVVLPTFEEETIDAFEVGLKTDLDGGRVRINVAAFMYEYDNLQYHATPKFQGYGIFKSEILVQRGCAFSTRCCLGTSC